MLVDPPSVLPPTCWSITCLPAFFWIHAYPPGSTHYMRARLLPHSPIYMEVATHNLSSSIALHKQADTDLSWWWESVICPTSLCPTPICSTPSIPPPSVLSAPSPHNPSSGTSPQHSSVTATLANVSPPSTTTGVPLNTRSPSQTLGSIPAHTRASFWDHFPLKPLQILHQMLNRTYSNNYSIHSHHQVTDQICGSFQAPSRSVVSHLPNSNTLSQGIVHPGINGQNFERP